MALTYVTTSLKIHDDQWEIRHFIDRVQFPTLDEQDAIGVLEWGQDVPEALWSLVGVLWPAGLVLAGIVARMDLRGRRVLEIGCGLALSSMIAHRDGCRITASDYNPFAAALLRENAVLNKLSPVRFERLSWQVGFDQERYDLILGSDVMYESGCGAFLIRFLRSALAADGQAIFVDPGRRHVGKFETDLRLSGFSCVSEKPDPRSRTRVLRITWLVGQARR